MLELLLSKKSHKVKKAKKNVERFEKTLKAGKVLRGRDLEEYKWSGKVLSRWSLLISKAELSAGTGIIASSKIVKNKAFKALLFSCGAVILADAGGNYLQNKGREYFSEVIEGQDEISEEKLRELLSK